MRFDFAVLIIQVPKTIALVAVFRTRLKREALSIFSKGPHALLLPDKGDING